MLTQWLDELVIESGYKPDSMVGLARGGWVLSRVLCDFLAVKDLVSLKVEHWGVTATPDERSTIERPVNFAVSSARARAVS